jgi:drug/metabolite transporter (DMT)-like permease
MIGPGEWLALLSGLAYAMANVLVAKGSACRSGDNGALLSILFTLLGSATLFILFPAEGLPKPVNVTGGIAAFAVSGILTVGLGRALLFKSVERLGAVRGSASNRLIPFFSVALAAAILGEEITALVGVGMLLIAAGFGLLVQHMLAEAQVEWAETRVQRSWAGYCFGPGSAFAYSLGYIFRKDGLGHVPDSNLGTLIGAVAGLVSYLLPAIFSKQHRSQVENVFANSTRWQVGASMAISCGQISQFAALSHIEVSRVVMISSSEMLFSVLFTSWLLKCERRVDALTLIALTLATIGVVLTTLG